ncbi:MAG TPA: DUF4190 domain-containing protein [Verrucomicrobiae bacterium]|jgi:hypothetical protein|nr:DUF4190 domain-containing protein [Verrucomicrobiae bacterium]
MPYPPSVPPAKNSGLAIWSLVFGILGLVLLLGCIGILFAIPAVICGHLAYGRIKRSNGTLDGEGIALAGLIIGYISIGLSIFLIPMLAAIAIPNFVKARDTAQKNVCINNLRTIDAAKQQWALENKKTGNDVPTPADLDPYIKGGFASLHCPKDGVYNINRVAEAPTCSITEHVLPLLSVRDEPVQSGPGSNWIGQLNPSGPFRGPLNSTNARFHLSTNQLAQMKESQEKNLCSINLFMIKNAKRIWATLKHEPPTAVPTEENLLPYLPNHKFPECPTDGTYTIGPAGEDPTCSVAGHGLPQPSTDRPAPSLPK